MSFGDQNLIPFWKQGEGIVGKNHSIRVEIKCWEMRQTEKLKIKQFGIIRKSSVDISLNTSVIFVFRA